MTIQGHNLFGGDAPPAPEYLRWLSRRGEHIREARRDPSAFAEYVFRDDLGRSLKQGQIHREWQNGLTANNRAIIIAPRNHGKTVQVCQARPLWELGNDPELIIKIISSNDVQARKRVKALKVHMERNSDLHRVFPILRRYRSTGRRRPNSVPESSGDWNLGSLTVAGRKNWWALDPSIQAKSIVASISGDRSGLLVFDDIADRRNSVELPRMRQRITEGLDDFVNTLHPDRGRAWGIGTLWHELDANHALMKVWPTYWYEITPNLTGYIRTPDGKERHLKNSLWPELWSKARLHARRKEIGIRKFLRGFGNRPMASDEQHVKPEWIEWWKTPPERNWKIVISIDAASTTGPKSDWTALVFHAINPDVAEGRAVASHRGMIKTFAAYHRKYTAPERVRLIESVYRQMIRAGYQIDAICIENRGGGQETIDYLVERKRIPAKLIQPVRPKSNKGDRIDRIAHYIENGTIEFNPAMDPGMGNVYVDSEQGNVVAELVSFPLAEYDDLADAFSQGIWVAILKYPGLRSIAAAATDDIEADDPGMPRAERSGGSRIWII